VLIIWNVEFQFKHSVSKCILKITNEPEFMLVTVLGSGLRNS